MSRTYAVEYYVDDSVTSQARTVTITPGYSVFEDIRKIVAAGLFGMTDRDSINRIQIYSVLQVN